MYVKRWGKKKAGGIKGVMWAGEVGPNRKVSWASREGNLLSLSLEEVKCSKGGTSQCPQRWGQAWFDRNCKTSGRGQVGQGKRGRWEQMRQGTGSRRTCIREMLAKAGSPVSLWSAMIRSSLEVLWCGMPSDPGFKMSIQSSGGWVLTRAM